MQMKQQQELQRYLQQVQQNIETLSTSELLQSLVASQTYGGQQPSLSAVWSSVVELAPATAGVVIYSTAGVRQSPLPATYVPAASQTLPDVSSCKTTIHDSQQMSASTVPADVECVALTGAATLSPTVTDNAVTAADIWSKPAVATVADVNTDSDTAIPDSLDLATKTDMEKTAEAAEIPSERYSPGMTQTDGTNSLKDEVRQAIVSSDDEVSNTEESAVHVTALCKQSAEAAGLLTGVLPLASDMVDRLSTQLPEVSSLGFVPIQNQLTSSRSDSMDSMASSVAGCSVQQSVEQSDLVHQPTTTSAAESKCNTTSVPVVSSQLLDTMHSLLGQLAAAGNCDAVPTQSHSATSEPAQQLQQSQTMIQQQQQQQLAAIASAIENLQHLRSLQEVIGNLAVALKTSQLEMLSSALQQAGEMSTPVPLPATGSVAVSSMTLPPAAVHLPTVAVSSCPAAALPPAAASMTEPPRNVAPPQSALGMLQYPTAGNASLLMQQQQQLLLAMMQSAAPYQQHILMQQLLSQNAAVMPPDAAAPTGGSRVAQQQPWPMMMWPPQSVGTTTMRRPSPGLSAMTPGVPLGVPAVTPGVPGVTPAVMPSMPVVTTGVPHSVPVMTPGVPPTVPGVTPSLPVVTPGLPPGLPAMTAGLPGVTAGQHVAQRLGVPVVTPGSLAATGTLQPTSTAVAAPQTPVPVRPPDASTSSSAVTVPTSLPDQR